MSIEEAIEQLKHLMAHGVPGDTPIGTWVLDANAPGGTRFEVATMLNYESVGGNQHAVALR